MEIKKVGENTYKKSNKDYIKGTLYIVVITIWATVMVALFI